MQQGPLGLPPSFAPRPHGRRTSGRGQAIEHGPETTLYVINLASKPASFTQMRATSRRTRQTSSLANQQSGSVRPRMMMNF
jgi:hypothetical protein